MAPDGSEIVRPAHEWVDRLPDPAALLNRPEGHEARPIRSARVSIRSAAGEAAVADEDGYLNRVEVFGEEGPGELRLHPDHLVIAREEQGAAGREESWPLESLTAVQASSSTLQLKRRGRTLLSFRFHDDAIYLWEELLRAALRDFYGRTGRGVIREFQPRISTR